MRKIQKKKSPKGSFALFSGKSLSYNAAGQEDEPEGLNKTRVFFPLGEHSFRRMLRALSSHFPAGSVWAYLGEKSTVCSQPAPSSLIYSSIVQGDSVSRVPHPRPRKLSSPCLHLSLAH